MLAGVVAVSLVAWQAGRSLVSSSGLAITGGSLMAFLWLGPYSTADPEPRAVHWLEVPGRLLLGIELALIAAGGLALWLAWHRAAGETYWTVAAIHVAVRYSRVAALWRG
jgi:hypothetical protein